MDIEIKVREILSKFGKEQRKYEEKKAKKKGFTSIEEYIQNKHEAQFKSKIRNKGKVRVSRIRPQDQRKMKNINSDNPSQHQLTELLEYYKDERYTVAEELALSIIHQFPKHQFSWKVLGAILKKMDRINESLIASQKSVELMPKDAAAHINLGTTFQELGRVNEAEASYKQAIKLKPEWLEAHSNLGIMLKELGRLDEAEAIYRQAIALKPDFPNIHCNLGTILQELGRLEEAEASYKQAISFKPDLIEAHNNLGNTLQELGRLDEAEASLRQATTLKPDLADAHNNLGNTLQGLGRLKEAEASLRQATVLKPDFAGAHSNLGNTLQGLGRLKEAEASLRQATALAPDFAEGHNNLGNTLQMQGKMEEAITSYRQALTLNPDYTDAYYNMGNALKGIRFSKSEPHMSEIICTIIEKNNLVRPIEISETVISLLKLEPTIKKLIKKQKEESLPLSLQNTIISLSNIPLLMKILESCPIPDLDIEFLLREIRSELLLNLSGVQDNTDILLFQISLAAQCFINEYLYEKTDIEIQQIIKLEDLVENNLVKGNFPTANVIACLASYKSLGDYSWASSLSMPMELESLYRKQILEPKEENTLRSTISKHKAITDTISSKVREQYEQNPYPRWMSLQLQPFPKSITELASQLNLKIQDSSINGVNYPKVLIAGCGTGQQSIGSAIRLKDCDVLAVDLSLNSLAYAKRKTEELRISNIEYMQMDILDVGEISRKFDIIESVGVLHHMDDPMAGWKNLVECLNTGGLMNIGLYSESARRHVVKIREEIKKKNINLSDDDIKSFRNQIVKSEKEHHKHIKLSLDLYSMSSIRDLLFHVQEHRFTIPQIKIHLEDLGLVFCGFEHPELSQIINSDVLSINNIYCLNEWEEFEIKNPHAFGGMYQFWCQKIG